MRRNILCIVGLVVVLGLLCSAVAKEKAGDGKLRIIMIGAHPDDCEIKGGGMAAKWAAKGHHVKIVSVTNGDTGHWEMGGGELALRRREESRKAAKILGIEETEVLDNHTGELVADVGNRRTLIRLIRDWKADIVISHRPNDYHPDHRYTAMLVQDTAYLVTVRLNCPYSPYLEKNPVYMYFEDRFQDPKPFRADVVVASDEAIEKKLGAVTAMESQFIEGGVSGDESMVPKNEAERAASIARVRGRFKSRFEKTADKYRDKLVEVYGEEKGKKVKYAEAFQLCEFGSRPSSDELKRLFMLSE